MHAQNRYSQQQRTNMNQRGQDRQREHDVAHGGRPSDERDGDWARNYGGNQQTRPINGGSGVYDDDAETPEFGGRGESRNFEPRAGGAYGDRRESGPTWGEQMREVGREQRYPRDQDFEDWQRAYGRFERDRREQASGGYAGQGSSDQPNSGRPSYGSQGYAGAQPTYGNRGNAGYQGEYGAQRSSGAQAFTGGRGIADAAGTGASGQQRGFGAMGDRDWSGGQGPTRPRGSAPKGYKRSDERIHEDVCERLMDDGLDCGEVEVKVKDGVVTLSGEITDRECKRRMEDIASEISGVTDVENNVRVSKHKGDKPGRDEHDRANASWKEKDHNGAAALAGGVSSAKHTMDNAGAGGQTKR